MKEIGYYNGKFCTRDEAVIPINDRGYYFGDGVYEAVFARNQIPFAAEEHLDRLENSLSFMRIPMPMPREELSALIAEAAKRVDAKEMIIYFQVTRGISPRVHAFPEGDVKPSLMLFAAEHYRRDVFVKYPLMIMPDTRWLHCNIKSLNLIPGVMAAQYAKENGCMETVLHRDGVVTECSSSNLFIIEQGVLRTAPLSNLLLPGITRKHMLELAKGLGIPTREEAFTIEEMMAADEIMVTSSSDHGACACTVDGTPVGGRGMDVARALQNAYIKKVEEATDR